MTLTTAMMKVTILFTQLSLLHKKTLHSKEIKTRIKLKWLSILYSFK